MTRPGARYSILVDNPPEPLLIQDVGAWHIHPTITNDAENVVLGLVHLGLLPAGRRLLYYDSDGRLDEIRVEDGRFAGFIPLPQRVGA